MECMAEWIRHTTHGRGSIYATGLGRALESTSPPSVHPAVLDTWCKELSFIHAAARLSSHSTELLRQR
jgi:hypothetical protein